MFLGYLRINVAQYSQPHFTKMTAVSFVVRKYLPIFWSVSTTLYSVVKSFSSYNDLHIQFFLGRSVFMYTISRNGNKHPDLLRLNNVILGLLDLIKYIEWKHHALKAHSDVIRVSVTEQTTVKCYLFVAHNWLAGFSDSNIFDVLTGRCPSCWFSFRRFWLVSRISLSALN